MYTAALSFEGAVQCDFASEDLIGMNPSDISEDKISNEVCYEPKYKRTRRVSKPTYPNYFYDFNSFEHPLSLYFYNQMYLADYDAIRLKDELIDFNCSSINALNTIFNIDMHFQETLPNENGGKTSLLEFCERIYQTLHDN